MQKGDVTILVREGHAAFHGVEDEWEMLSSEVMFGDSFQRGIMADKKLVRRRLQMRENLIGKQLSAGNFLALSNHKKLLPIARMHFPR